MMVASELDPRVMRIIILLVSVLCFQSGIAATPILEAGVAGLSSADTLQESLEKLESRCEEIRNVAVVPPSFPLAKNQENHLICHGFSIGSERVESLALTFADDKLVMIFAEGHAAQVFLDFASTPLKQYLQFTVSFNDLLIADRDKDHAWLLTTPAAHPNLCLWANPYIHGSEAAKYENSAKIPDILGFSKSLEELRPLLEAQCAFTHLGTYKVWLLNQPELQQQVDCFGYEFAGFPRKIEAVFGDGTLEQAWILTGKGEEDRVREALIAAF